MFPNLPGNLTCAVALLGLSAILSAAAAQESTAPISPRICRLLKSASADPSAVEDFWQECAGKCPLVEPTDNPQEFLVTFLWRGDASVSRIEARGGPYFNSRTPLERLPKTDVWYRSEVLPADARFVYGLIVTQSVEKQNADGSVRRELVVTYPLDPRNPHVFNEGPVLELPDAPQDSWHVSRLEAPKGDLRSYDVASAILREMRRLRLYTPAKFDPARDHALAVFLDGEDSERLMALPTVLDNLLAAGEIPPTVALLVDSQHSRGRDLVFSDNFLQFLTDEALPWADKQAGLRRTPPTTLIGGASLGGLTAAYAAHRRPDVFGLVLSQSGAFWRPHPEKSTSDEAWFPGEASRQTPKSVRYVLEVGRFESPSMIDNNRRMRDVLTANGNAVTYAEYNGGHDHVNWRVSVANGIRTLLNQKPHD